MLLQLKTSDLGGGRNPPPSQVQRVFKSPGKVGLKFGKKQIHQEKYAKFLGVLLDEHLTWKYHITELSRKLARVSGVSLR